MSRFGQQTDRLMRHSRNLFGLAGFTPHGVMGKFNRYLVSRVETIHRGLMAFGVSREAALLLAATKRICWVRP